MITNRFHKIGTFGLALALSTSGSVGAQELISWKDCTEQTPGGQGSTVCEVSDWQSTELRSREGVSVSIDYQIVHTLFASNKPYRYYRLYPIYINVSGANVGEGEQIRVALNNQMQNLGDCGMASYPWAEETILDLARAPEGHYYGKLSDALALVLAPYCQTEVSLGQDLSVVIDGHWLVDPITGTTHFGLDLGESIVSRYRR